VSKLSGLGQRLYSGEASIDFIGRRRTWYILSTVILLISIGAVLFRGLNLGIEFRGGAEFAIPNATCSVEQARTVAETGSGGQSIVTQTGSGTVRVQTESLTPATSDVLAGQLAGACGVAKSEIKVQVVGPTWGAEISRKALQGLGVFLILVTIFLSIYFEWRMALAALLALAHDLVITIGIYALTGLEVTPATVIGVLTILGYSLYDTVVVFDKVKENTRGITGQSMLTYSEAANLAVNQTLVRSINTSIVALLPVLAIIIVGAGLVQLKDRQPEIRSLAARVAARRAQAARTGGGSAAEIEGDATEIPGVSATPPTRAASGPRQQPKRAPRSRRQKG
jgi:preprotein translocase subunit SecF